MHPMDALAATKPGVFVLDIKTIPALFHLANQPRQKFKLALSVGHSVPKRSADRQPDAQPTNRRINRHKTAASSKPAPPFFISPTNRGKSPHHGNKERMTAGSISIFIIAKSAEPASLSEAPMCQTVLSTIRKRSCDFL